MMGAYGGKRLGAIRDAKGKSVASVFSELGGNQKAEVSLDLRDEATCHGTLLTGGAYSDSPWTSHENTWYHAIMRLKREICSIQLIQNVVSL
jgi:hypothetical protein